MRFEITPRWIVATTAAIGSLAIVGYEVGRPNTGGCDTQLGNPLTWVSCPISDVGNMLSGGAKDGLSDQLRSVPLPTDK